MTAAGWVLMTCSIGFVVALTGFCFYRVFQTPEPREHVHAPLEIDTKERPE